MRRMIIDKTCCQNTAENVRQDIQRYFVPAAKVLLAAIREDELGIDEVTATLEMWVSIGKE